MRDSLKRWAQFALGQPFSPVLLNILVTSVCNMRCTHCFFAEELDDAPRKKLQMKTRDIERISEMNAAPRQETPRCRSISSLLSSRVEWKTAEKYAYPHLTHYPPAAAFDRPVIIKSELRYCAPPTVRTRIKLLSKRRLESDHTTKPVCVANTRDYLL